MRQQQKKIGKFTLECDIWDLWYPCISTSSHKIIISKLSRKFGGHTQNYRWDTGHPIIKIPKSPDWIGLIDLNKT